MEKWSQSLQRRLSNLEQKIESLLVMELEGKSPGPQAAHFEPIHDIKMIKTLSRELPEDIDDRTLIVFSKLSMFFEVGILLEKEFTNWKAQAFFHEGRFKSVTEDNLDIKGGPQISPLQIVKAPAEPFLKQLKIYNSVEKPQDLTAFLLRPHDQVSFLLMTRLVGPWLKNHMNEIHEQILVAFA